MTCESEKGVRPIGTILNSSPSATAGYGEELPEPINYFNNLVRFGLEYGARMYHAHIVTATLEYRF